MTAVLIDDAWGDSLTPSPATGRPASPVTITAQHPPPSPPPRDSHRSRRARRSLDEPASSDEMATVSKELHELRVLSARQQRQQTAVMYVATGIVLLLLLLTAHSYSRLQYATECLLQWQR